MTDDMQLSNKFWAAHWTAFVLLFLLMAQPTVDNIRSLIDGNWVGLEPAIAVTFENMIGHVIAMAIGWVGLWLFYQRRKLGAYLSFAAHLIGLGAAYLGFGDELLGMLPPSALAVFFVILGTFTLGPVLAFKDQYS